MKARTQSLLIIFVKNVIPGKVKTRLASSIGNAAAMLVYKALLEHTYSVVTDLPCDKIVYYSDFVPEHDGWNDVVIEKGLQQGESLGERMRNAFVEGFEKGYKSITIIGSDCFELTPGILKTAFDKLSTKDAVVGPAFDGGYYLLGLNRFCERVFQNKKWSTDSVLSSTLNDFEEESIDYAMLPTLRDVDELADLKHSKMERFNNRG